MDGSSNFGVSHSGLACECLDTNELPRAAMRWACDVSAYDANDDYDDEAPQPCGFPDTDDELDQPRYHPHYRPLCSGSKPAGSFEEDIQSQSQLRSVSWSVMAFMPVLLPVSAIQPPSTGIDGMITYPPRFFTCTTMERCDTTALGSFPITMIHNDITQCGIHNDTAQGTSTDDPSDITAMDEHDASIREWLLANDHVHDTSFDSDFESSDSNSESSNDIDAAEIDDEVILNACPEYTCDDTSDSQGLCSICQDVCADGQQLCSVSACKHTFHKECLVPWLKRRPKCPNCRQHVMRDH